MASKKTAATLNYSNMTEEAFELFSNATIAINKLALAEQELKRAIEALPETVKTDKHAKAEALKRERTAKAEAKERANGLSLLVISRFVSTTDAISGDFFKFDMEAFLRNIGVLTGDMDDLKKSAVRRIEKFRQCVTDRKTSDMVKRKNGDSFLTYTEGRDIKNTYIELVLAMIDGFVDSGCFQYSKGMFTRVDFSNNEV